MAQTSVTVQASKRWFFMPALLIIVALGRLGILRDKERAAKWLADHAMRLEVV